MTAVNDITGDSLHSKATTPEYLKGHSLAFGNKPVQRGSWVYDAATRKLVERAPKKVVRHDVFIKGFDAYESPITGEVISNNVQRDRDLKQSGSRTYEGLASEKREAALHRGYEDKKLQAGMSETLKQTYYDIEHGYINVED